MAVVPVELEMIAVRINFYTSVAGDAGLEPVR